MSISLESIICNIDKSPIKDERSFRQYLFSKEFSPAMIDFFIEDINNSPLRYIIADDSGSMQIQDGSRYVPETNSTTKCSRWNELKDTLKFQMECANEGLINTKFLFLNGGELELGNEKRDKSHYERYLTLQGGKTPLCGKLNKIIDEIKPVSDHFVQNRKKINIVIETDGEASDGDLRVPLTELKKYPVKITLRLCTNEEKVVEYWNAIDRDLEMNFDTVDDYISEATQLQQVNSWFTYGVPMHRMREFGLVTSEIDKLDEIRNDNDSTCVIARIIYGRDAVTDGIPLSNADIRKLNEQYNLKIKNAITGKDEFWIKEGAIIEGGGCCIIC